MDLAEGARIKGFRQFGNRRGLGPHAKKTAARTREPSGLVGPRYSTRRAQRWTLVAVYHLSLSATKESRKSGRLLAGNAQPEPIGPELNCATLTHRDSRMCPSDRCPPEPSPCGFRPQRRPNQTMRNLSRGCAGRETRETRGTSVDSTRRRSRPDRRAARQIAADLRAKNLRQVAAPNRLDRVGRDHRQRKHRQRRSVRIDLADRAMPRVMRFRSRLRRVRRTRLRHLDHRLRGAA